MPLLLIAAATVIYFLLPRPDLFTYHDYSRAYLDANGKLLRINLSGDDKYRLPVRLENVSPIVQQATILYEDQHYYQHPGVNIVALFRAFWTTYIKRQRVVGASTIAMQVARLRWNIKTRTFTGKLLQILRAIQLTRHFSKNEILQAYFNLASYGRNIEGIEAASQIYFKHPASELTLPEAMMLAVIPQNPNKRNPTSEKGMQNILEARKRLFERWQSKYIADRNEELFMELSLQVRKPEQLPFIAPHFIQYLDKQLPRDTHGTIHTSLDGHLQQQLKHQLNNYLSRVREKGIQNAAAAIIDSRTMQLKALQGSAGFFNHAINGQVNAFTARRSPGSALKPFIYALAMEQGLIHPMTLLKDAPRQFAGFTPENFDKRFRGPIVAQQALITSRNVPAVILQSRLGDNNLYSLLKKAGVKNLRPETFYGLALGLGGVEVSMKELIELYAMLANGGLHRPIETLKVEKPEKSAQRLLSKEVSYLTLDMLDKNPAPDRSGQNLFSATRQKVAWKTGTSYAFRDAWAIGVTGPYVIAVWVGNFNGQGNSAFVGRTAAGPLLFDLIAGLNNQDDWQQREHFSMKQLNLRKVDVCADTGDLPGKYCPQISQSWFIPGVSPIKVSTVYRAVTIDNKTGLRACWFDQATTRKEIYPFWQSDLLVIFRQAGVMLKSPPAYHSRCLLNDKSAFGQLPEIRSPDSKLIYTIQSDRLSRERIPMSAVVDADVRKLYWFLNDRFIGESEKGKDFFWKPERGKFTLRVVDDHGRASETRLRIEMER